VAISSSTFYRCLPYATTIVRPHGGIVINLLLLSSALGLELLYLALFIVTIKRPPFRFWPPPSARSWQFFVAWTIAALVAVDFLFLGLLDYESFILPGFWARLPIALAFFIPGGVIGSWAWITLPFRVTIGLGDRLITAGPYRYSRNPQYIGDSLHIVGYFFLTNSWMVGVLGLVGVTLNLLAPLTEEPWLEQRFGGEYLEYKQRVPRFIGRPKSDAA
jgi:protein-S-isoprenylcysteine O-methyltransferase Ste14